LASSVRDVTKHAPKVSVVIPTRNRWPLLSRAALRSALTQEEIELEVIVVDDGSTDETPQRLAAAGVADPRLRVVRHAASRGVAAARNAGIAAARGEWVAFLDDDDFWSPRKLRQQTDVAAAAGAEFVYAGVVSVDELGAAQYEFSLPDPAVLPLRILAASVLPAGCSNVVARTEVVRSIGGFDERLFQLSDWDLWIRLAWSCKAAACTDVLVGYLEHSENMLLSDSRDVTRELAYLDQKHAALRIAHGVDLDRVTFSHWVAWGHLRRSRRLSAARVFFGSGIANRRRSDIALAAAFLLRAVLPVAGARSALHALTGSRPRRGSAPAREPAWLRLYR